MEIDKQHALIRELELPVACLVHSGKKSLHAIVKVDAADYAEYRKRVDYLYDIWPEEWSGDRPAEPEPVQIVPYARCDAR